MIIFGFGPGISTAVAERFGKAGFSLALVSRRPEPLEAGVAALKAKGIKAVAVPADASDPAAVRGAIAKARAELGAISAIHWNAIGGSEVGDLLSAGADAVRGLFDVAIGGLLAAVQAARADLKAAGNGAVLVTNGAFGELSPQIDKMVVGMKVAGVALANGGKTKLVGILAEQLRADGIYVGQVMVAGAVKGTPWAREGGIEASLIADAFWKLYEGRTEIAARIS